RMVLENRSASKNGSRDATLATAKKPTPQATIAATATPKRAKGDEPVAPSRRARLAGNGAHAKAALAADMAHHQPDRACVQGATSTYLLDKKDILSITHVTFPTIWTWMRAGTFPRSRVVGGKSMWLSSEVERWLSDLPVRVLKGDAKVEVG